MVNNSKEEKRQTLSLPERRILIGRTVYCIHGLVHRTLRVKINPSFKEEVNRQLKDFHILCEDGFTSWIPSAVSMNEIEYFNLDKLSFFEMAHFWGSFAYFCFSSLNKKQEPDYQQRLQN